MRFGTIMTGLLMNILIMAIADKEFGWIGPVFVLVAYGLGTYLNIKYPDWTI